MALKQREDALNRYEKNPIFCKFCNTKVIVPIGVKVSTIRKKNFCSQRCSALFLHKNGTYDNCKKKRSIKICLSCQAEFQFDYKNRSGRKYCKKCHISIFMARGEKIKCKSNCSDIRDHARQTMRGENRECAVCKYSLHVEVCHRVAVKNFPENTKLKDINKKDNLLFLCPNHHWEFDRGRLKI